jgi:ACS family hexuronate transporter-like MFS transporter
MKMKGLRWWVIFLVTLATVINYIDRQTLSVLWPFMGHEIYPQKSDAQLKEVYGRICNRRWLSDSCNVKRVDIVS